MTDKKSQRIPAKRRLRRPTHPGEAFKSLVLEENNIAVGEFAKRIHEFMPEVSLETVRVKLSGFLNSKRDLTWDFALVIAEASQTRADMWMAYQNGRDRWDAEERRLKIRKATKEQPASSFVGA